MKNLFEILKKPIVQVSSLNAVSVVIRIFGGLIVAKAIAAYVGAAGLAVVENMRKFLTPVESFATVGMQNGIIKYVAENQKKEKQLYSVLATVFLSIFIVVICFSLLLFLLSGYCSEWIFRDYEQYAWVFKVLAFSLPWYAGSLIFIAILNGFGDYKKVIRLNISGNITGVLLSVFLMWKFQTSGALLGLILFQAVFFIFTFYVIWQRFNGFPFLSLKYFDKAILKGLLSYSFMSLFSAVLLPVVAITINNKLIDDFSFETAGLWSAMNRLSSFYMMFASTMLTVYFLPKLSVASTISETKHVFASYYKSMLPLFAIGLAILYFLREFVVLFIFKEEFLPMTELFLWQLLGDFFKVGSLILGYQFFAKKLTTAFVVTETISSLILLASSMFLITGFGVKGAVMGHAFTYLIYWIILVVYFRKMLIKLEK
ncbi:MAG: O-antigen translocase [Flavobacterium psychrophilum]|nr:MAG: O-antigen translocase [Flavobacterium psychrophilum]